MIYSDIFSHFLSPDYGLYFAAELVNFFFCIAILCFVFKKNLIPANHFVIWLFFFATPLVVNYILVDPLLFQDQFNYWYGVVEVRNEGLFNQSLEITKLSDLRTFGVDFSSVLWSFIPIPLVLSVTSVAFANKIILFGLYLWLHRKYSNPYFIYIFLIPSLILYSSLSLRDPLIIFFSVLVIIFSIERRFIFLLLSIIALGFLKIQNAMIMGLIPLGIYLFQAHKSLLGLLLLFLTVLSVGFIFEDRIVEGLNFFRLAFYLEDTRKLDLSIYEEVELLGSTAFYEIVFESIVLIPNFLLVPLPTQIDSIFKMIQFFENIFLIFLTISIIRLSLRKDKILTLFLLFILFMGLAVYAYVIANVGTAVRYRFVFMYPFLMYLFLTSFVSKNKTQENA